MQFAFDLISDLHVDTWDSFDWTDQATSPYCVVAGDLARDRERLVDTLTQLGSIYAGVFFIDGNEDHRAYYDDIGNSYKDLSQRLENIPNVVFMQDRLIIINGVAIIATNGWWSYDFDPTIDFDESLQWYANHVQSTTDVAANLVGMAFHDVKYLKSSVKKLQTHPDVKSIVMITHTVPAPWITEHDLELKHTLRYNSLGNKHLQSVLDEDTENKIHTWCFGHYHKEVDRDFAGIRYVSNPRGRGGTPWGKVAYYPKRIELKF